MKTAVILASGEGKKIWPFAEIRPKAMIPLSNQPVIEYNITTLIDAGFDKIIIGANEFSGQIKNYFRDESKVTIIETGVTNGTAETLYTLKDSITEKNFLVLYGDTVIDQDDLIPFVHTYEASHAAVLVAKLKEPSGNWIGCNVHDGKLKNIIGHSRGDTNYQFAAFIFNEGIFDLLGCNSGRFTETEVGMMAPIEAYLEMTLTDYMSDGNEVQAVLCKKSIIDLDKPWHIMNASEHLNQLKCEALTENILAEGASIDDSAVIKGYVKLGKNSHIGHNVVIKGNVVVGDNTTIENGALLLGTNVIGDNCYIANYCYIEDGTTVGHNCVINHCAELCGVIFNRVYLYHYMELFGVIGENTDIGAATVCGSLRFDDGETVHNVNGRKEIPKDNSSATFLGDYCRTGVNVTIFPGCKVGPYSVIGPGTLLRKDVKNRTLIYPKQELIEKPWGPEKYGW